MHDEDFGLGHTPADTEILSSNTKKVPDSPHAESTAISGHADQEEVHREKHRADLETAKSDPFQRRRGSKMPTTFLRKLTGEDDVAKHTEPPAMPAEASQDDPEADEVSIQSQPLPKDSPSLFKHRAQTNQVRVLEHAQALTFESTRAAHISRNKPTRTEGSLAPSDRSSSARCAAAKRTRHMDVNAEEQVQSTNDSVEDTPLDVQDRVIDLDDDTTLFGDLRLRSSPPIPDSSSIRDAYSDESSPQTSRADEIEWEAAPRDLHEQLLRTNNETTATDVADVFAEDGERLLDLHLERQCGESVEAFQGLASNK